MRRDLLQAFRRLTRQPSLAINVICALAAALGISTAAAAILHELVIKPLPFPDAESLVTIDGVFTRLPLSITAAGLELSEPLRLPELAAARAFSAMGMYSVAGVNVSGDQPERTRAAAVTPGFFATLRVAPSVGRVFSDDDLARTNRVVVISTHLWRERYQSTHEIIGRSISLNGRLFAVVAVMPNGFDFPDGSDLWFPSDADPQIARRLAVPALIGRLRAGETLRSGRDDLVSILSDGAYTKQEPGKSALRVTSLHESLVARLRPILWVVTAAALVLLIVSSLNAAGLLLTAVHARNAEFAIRRAIGATSSALVRQVVLEVFMLVLAAAMLAIPTASTSLGFIRAFAPATLFSPSSLVLGTRTPAILGALSLLTALIAVAFPAVVAATAAAVPQRMTRDKVWRRFHGTIVTLQIAASLVLITSAAALVRTIERLASVDPGARNKNALVMEVTLPAATYGASPRIAQFFAQAQEALRGMPGVDSAAAASHVPGAVSITPSMPLRVRGMSVPSGMVTANALRLPVSTGYFETLGIDLRAGREFTEHDRGTGRAAAVVSESYARAFSLTPAQALGREVSVWIGREGDQWAVIVGVARDVRMRGPESEPAPILYVPIPQAPLTASGFLIVRGRQPAAALVPLIRSEIVRIDPALPLYNVRTVDAIQSGYLETRRFAMAMVSAFALVAVLVASLGVYSAVGYMVRLRTREIGIRLAVGATPLAIRRHMISAAAHYAGAGVLIGMFAVPSARKLLAAAVPSVEPANAAQTAAAMLTVFLVSTSAAWRPARRAAGIDPIGALRSE